MKKVLVIDNYDSFVYNLVHYLEEFPSKVQVKRNDQLQLEEIEQYDKILLSPGPGVPEEAGLLKTLIRKYAGQKSILGICLGQQAIAEVFGGKLINLPTVYHGVATSVNQTVQEELLFKNVPRNFMAGRYHSWTVHPTLPDCLESTSEDPSGNIMSLRHKEMDIRSVQFHPESILTPHGKKIIQNWLDN